MSYLKEIIALGLFVMLLVISYFILPSFRKSIEVQKPRKFENKMLFRIDTIPQSYHLDDHHSDIEIDLKITYPYAILTVDEPVDISAVATINPDLFPNVRNIVIGFDAAYAYPPESEGVPGMDLTKTQDNKMVGTTKIFWPIEGRYKADCGIELTGGIKVPTAHSVDIFTVNPKSVLVSMETNRALLTLSIAGYFLGIISAIKIIVDLLTA